ncbi:MAG TPA: hypothetical protein VL979_05625 [Solirubrobacteraceae bacterium]|nr:hypothetical protein [Solirubrobacteraceae bacterium]
MGISQRIWIALLTGTRRSLEDERGEVLPWLGLTIMLVALVVAIMAALRPAVLSDVQKIISELGGS